MKKIYRHSIGTGVSRQTVQDDAGAAPQTNCGILLEDGGKVLLEDGGKILLETCDYPQQ